MSKRANPIHALSAALALAATAVHADVLTFERIHADPPVSGPVALDVCRTE